MKLIELIVLTESPESKFHDLLIQVRKGIEMPDLEHELDELGIELNIKEFSNPAMDSYVLKCIGGNYLNGTITLRIQSKTGRMDKDAYTSEITGLDATLSHELIHNFQDDSMNGRSRMPHIKHASTHGRAEYFLSELERPAQLHSVALSLAQDKVSVEHFLTTINNAVKGNMGEMPEDDLHIRLKKEIFGHSATSDTDPTISLAASYIQAMSGSGDKRDMAKKQFAAFAKLLRNKFKSISAHYNDSHKKAYALNDAEFG